MTVLQQKISQETSGASSLVPFNMSNPLADALYSLVFNKALTGDYCPEMKKTLSSFLFHLLLFRFPNKIYLRRRHNINKIFFPIFFFRSCFFSFYDSCVFQQNISQETSGVSSEVSFTMNNPAQR